MVHSILAFSPECFILLIACTLLLKDFKSSNLRFYISLMVFVPLMLLGFMPELYGSHFCGMMVLDQLSLFGKGLLLSFGLVWCGVDEKKEREYTVLFLLSLLGACCLVSSNHMLTTYLSLELHVLPLYALIALRKDSKLAMEASLKYFILGTLASIFILYGMGLLYGATGSLGFEEVLSFKGSETLMFQGCSVFVLCGLLFKLALFPFHGWVPDVYEGSSNNQVAFIGVIPKLAVFFLLLRLRTFSFLDVLSWVSVVSILFGAVMALRQQNLRRLLAYGGISQMGFVLLGYSLKTNAGFVDAVVYLGVYALVFNGFFLALKPLKGIETVDDLKGLFQKNPALAFLIGIMILSFAGIPPIAGFWTKFHILLETIQQGYIFQALGALVGAVISFTYYLNILRVMFFESPSLVTPAQVALDPRLCGGDKFEEMLLTKKGETSVVFSYKKGPLIVTALFLLFFFLLQGPISLVVSECL
jgi:NADH-quinone oxidoreductase subunit N